MSDPYVQRPVTTTTAPPRTGAEVYYDVDTTAYVNRKDRVRWASILAGLVTVMALLIVFTVLGIAVGLAAFDPDTFNFGIGPGLGIYGLIIGLLAFFAGGFVAARTAAVGGQDNGMLQGLMVWMLTLVLVVNMLGTGLGALMGMTAEAAGAAAGAAADVIGDTVNQAGDAAAGVPAAIGDAVEDITGQDQPLPGATVQANQPGAQQGLDTTAQTGQIQSGQDTTAQTQPLPNVTSQQLETAADNISRAAWMTLLGLGITALAAIFGGIVGARAPFYRRVTTVTS